MKEYTGNLGDIDLKLIKGTYVAENFMIDKINERGSDDSVPFISVPRVDISLDWGSLLKGKIASNVIVTKPVINFTYEIYEDKELQQDTTDFKKLIRSLSPIDLNRFEIRDAQIHFIDRSSDPPIDIFMDNLNVTATNLSNKVEEDKLLPSHIIADASMYDGKFTLTMDLDPLNKKPTFEMETELTNMNLSKLNEFFKAYGNFAVEKGSFSLYAEFAGKDGNFGGYVKPFIEDFSIKKVKEDDDLGQRVWEILVGTSMKILENPETDQVATKVPVNGEFNDADIDMWHAIYSVLRNAFVQALRPAIENSINVNKMKTDTKETFLEKIFGGKDDDKK